MAIETKTVRRGVRAVARLCGVSPSHLSRVLSGERTPGTRLLLALEARGVKVGQQARKGRQG